LAHGWATWWNQDVVEHMARVASKRRAPAGARQVVGRRPLGEDAAEQAAEPAYQMGATDLDNRKLVLLRSLLLRLWDSYELPPNRSTVRAAALADAVKPEECLRILYCARPALSCLYFADNFC